MRTRVLEMVVGVFVVALALGLGLKIAEACDGMAASASVEACEDDFDFDPHAPCDWSENEEWCNNSNGRFWIGVEVKEDFPSSCVSQATYNCNIPLKPCYRPVECEWVDEKCQMVTGSGGVWKSRPKRTSVLCAPQS